MEIRLEDFKIEVGLRAYEEYFGEKVLNSSVSIIRDFYKPAIYIKHIPTNKRSYSVGYDSQLKNKSHAMQELYKLIGEDIYGKD